MFDFAGHMNSALDVRLFGERTTYTPKIGSALIIDAEWVTRAPEPDVRDDGAHDTQEAVVNVRTSDIANPEREATLTRHATNETWTVTKKPRNLNGVKWALSVARAEATETIPGNYREA